MDPRRVPVALAALFDSEQLGTLYALLDALVPPDDFPGAVGAGVPDYLAGQLRDELASCVSTYAAGLDGLSGEAQNRFGTGFASLSPHQQERLLLEVEAGRVCTTWATDPQRFFTTVLEHTMEGFYADPGNGGNRHAVSWRMIGFEVTG